MKHCDWQKKKQTIEFWKDQSGAAIFIGNLEVAHETGFKCCADRIALWGCFEDEFDPINFCPFDTFLKNNLAK